MTKNCPCCSGPGVLLGTLGVRHYRCRDCGWTYHGKTTKTTVRKATPEEAERFKRDGTPIILSNGLVAFRL